MKPLQRANASWPKIPAAFWRLWPDTPRRVPQLWAYSVAVLSVALMTAIIGAVQTLAPSRNFSLLYLLAILWLAAVFGRAPAIVASVLAFFAYDFFFIPPLHRFTVDDPTQWIALFALLATSLVLGQLTATVQARAREALESQRQTATVYTLSELIASISDQGSLLAALTGRVIEVFADDGVLACSLVTLEGQEPVAQAAATATSLVGQERERLVQAIGLVAREQRAQASWALEHGRRVGGPIVTADGGVSSLAAPLFCYFLPLRSRATTRGLLGIAGTERIRALIEQATQRPSAKDTPQRSEAISTTEKSPLTNHEGMVAQAKLLRAFIEQIGLALDRLALQRQAIHAEALSESDRLKDALLGSVTHDLRTPLAAIKAATASLHDQHVAPAAREELLDSIETSVERLNRLVGNLLDLSRLEAGVAAPQMDWELIGDVVATVLDSMELAGVLHGRTVTVEIPDDLPLIPMDHAQIERVLTNVLENAVKYSPAATPIKVQAATVGDAAESTEHLEVRVSDQGIGIPPAELRAVFGKFYRVQRVRLPWANGAADERLPATPAGTGLGLAIAEAIVQAHGGQIWAESSPGKGTTVVFRLPIPAERPSGELPEVAALADLADAPAATTEEIGQPS